MSLSLCVFLPLLFPPLSADAQETRSNTQTEPKFNASIRLSNGIRVAFATQTQPATAIQFAPSITEARAGEGIHRAFVDKEVGFFFGYEVKVEPVPNSRQIKVLILPMSAEFGQRLRQRSAFRNRSMHPDFTSASLFQTRAEQLVNEGDLIALDALVNQKTGVKIVEIIKVSYEEIPLGSTSATSGPGGGASAVAGRSSGVSSARTDQVRDFSLDDVELKVLNYRLLLNGDLIAGDRPTGGCSGALVWFYLPGRGRFILSIRPHEGYDFQKIGMIDGDEVSFTIGGDHYQWISSSPVAPAGERVSIWVLHDAGYRPELDERVAASSVRKPGSNIKRSARAGLLIGAADKIEYLFPRR